MSRTKRKIFVTALMLSSFLFLVYVTVLFDQKKSSLWQGPVQAENIIFGGDVFLGRQVEDRIKQYGAQWPFLEIKEIFQRNKAVVVNFESAMAVNHQKTPYFTFQFSVDKAIASVLPNVGVTHVGLANNHAYDYGIAGYDNARNILAKNMSVFGHPATPDAASVTYIDMAGVNVALIGLYAVTTVPDGEAVAAVFKEAEKYSDKQVVFIHWGEEYVPKHTIAQETFAKSLIKEGADLIIGHHPHVVQDVAIYDGVPVFYSLGNLVFDQYFSQAVQEGLLLEWNPRATTITLIPITTVGQPMQPRPMTPAEQQVFLESIALQSDPMLHDDIIKAELSW